MNERTQNMRQSAQFLKICIGTVLGLVLGISVNNNTLAQSKSAASVVQRLQQHRQKSLQEKLYLHLDRQVYVCGDDMWFKVYSVDGTLHQPLDISKVAYIELLREGQKPVLQAKVMLSEGTGKGAFQLPATLESGSYTVRAYTSWMKNFSSGFFFEQPVTIINTFEQLPSAGDKKANDYKVQFFPEGGNLLAGVNSKVAFKITNGQTGKGAALRGEVRDEAGSHVADLKPYRFGMGHFVFTPEAGKRYTASILLPGGQRLAQPFPQVHEQGYNLQMEEMADNRLKIDVKAVGHLGEAVYLLGHARQQIVVSENTILLEGKATIVLDKASLADGINHFTVFDAAGMPVCERLFFKQPSRQYQLSLQAAKARYNLREQVTLDLLADATYGTATASNLSMAVYRLDSLQHAPERMIDSYIWLESDLKGVVESPSYYFSESGRLDLQAMDNLMLTHGWSRFKWDAVLQNEQNPLPFVPEYHGHLLRAKVTHKGSGLPAQGITTYLASPGSPIRFYNAVSNENGVALFEVKDYFGSRDMVLQTDFNKDSTYHFELLNPFSEQYSRTNQPTFNLSHSWLGNVAERHVQVQLQHAYHGEKNNNFRSPVKDTTAFYGEVSEQYYLDSYKRFKVMEEVMREYVQGVQVRTRGRRFHFMVLNRPHKELFRQNPMVLLDGVPVFSIDKIMAFDPLKVNKLEVIARRFYHGPLEYEGLVSYQTYTGDLAGFELDPRALMQTYEGLQLEREFYAPAYDTEKQRQSRLADFRNLLHWAPQIKLTADKAEQIRFYTSEQTGAYLVVVQGITTDGQPFSKMLTFDVEGTVAKK
ncbi:hypothetical protein H9Q13_16505 [Pontibacter sp. JH31]|uniref:MG2 domain-containing protein n=1 Tax=Pontibacter aquaedesilientis TaxID=2766980 RepID=A0ABR7XKF2_9BACT|nr:hypothetical protein [Pontibacter aquaedesilientis]MBD1398777.1 hypothetical protein [Pontibacter aquaedesilientis]